MARISKKKAAPTKPIELPFGTWVAATDIAGPHPSVPLVFGSSVDYFDNNLAWLTKSGIELLLRTHPIGVTAEKDSNGKYYVVTGLRTWQLYQAGLQRNLIKSAIIPIVPIPECIDVEAIQKISSIDFHLSFYLYSLNHHSFDEQITRIEQQIDDTMWRELFGMRPRRVRSIGGSHGKLTAVKQKSPAAIDSNGNPIKRQRGRPRKVPLENTPDRDGSTG